RHGLPVWFREGAVLFLSGDRLTNKLKHVPQEAEARMAYGAALDRFSRLVEQFGEATVMGWISAGLPPAAMQALATRCWPSGARPIATRCRCPPDNSSGSL